MASELLWARAGAVASVQTACLLMFTPPAASLCGGFCFLFFFFLQSPDVGRIVHFPINGESHVFEEVEWEDRGWNSCQSSVSHDCP